MATSSDSDIDAAILSAASDQWRKVALIIGNVVSRRDEIAAESELVAKRIVALVKSGRLESQGDLSKWRYSEVRLTK